VAHSSLIAADTARAVFGELGVSLVSVVVAISTFGALIAIMLAAPRIFFAMADDRLFFEPLARVHPRYRTPYVAILLSMALGVLFVLTRTFEQLADTFVLSIWPFYGVAIAGLYRLRRTRPDLARPYKVPGIRSHPPYSLRRRVSRGQCVRRGSSLDDSDVCHRSGWRPLYYVSFRTRGH
jgi:amino acid transporter